MEKSTKVTKNLALTANKEKVVDIKDRLARYMFAEKGQEIPEALAKKYGLLKESKKEEIKEQEKPEDKSKDKPETKPIWKPETKRR